MFQKYKFYAITLLVIAVLAGWFIAPRWEFNFKVECKYNCGNGVQRDQNGYLPAEQDISSMVYANSRFTEKDGIIHYMIAFREPSLFNTGTKWYCHTDSKALFDATSRYDEIPFVWIDGVPGRDDMECFESTYEFSKFIDTNGNQINK